MATISLETFAGVLKVHALAVTDTPILVLEGGPKSETPFVRFHSSCVFSEAFRAKDCDCAYQLDAALSWICESGGYITYAWEEGRGIGILAKVAAIAVQQTDHVDTAQAFRRLGHNRDPRDFKIHIDALRTVYSGSRIRFATHNPQKVAAIVAAGFEIIELIDLEVPLTPEIVRYRREKAEALQHRHDFRSST